MARPSGPPLPYAARVKATAFGPDGRLVVTGGERAPAQLWRVPQPLKSEVEWVKLWVEVGTGRRVDAGGTMLDLDELRKPGGAPPL